MGARSLTKWRDSEDSFTVRKKHHVLQRLFMWGIKFKGPFDAGYKWESSIKRQRRISRGYMRYGFSSHWSVFSNASVATHVVAWFRSLVAFTQQQKHRIFHKGENNIYNTRIPKKPVSFHFYVAGNTHRTPLAVSWNLMPSNRVATYLPHRLKNSRRLQGELLF